MDFHRNISMLLEFVDSLAVVIVCVFQFLFRNMGIHSSHVSGLHRLLLHVKFSHTFPVLWEFIHPVFWKLHGFLLQEKNLRNP